jgi:hypothetical protein
MDRSEPEIWHAAQLELIAFPVEPNALMEQAWLEELMGECKESVRRRHERIDSTEYNGHQVKLTLDVTRIRWALGPIVSLDSLEDIKAAPTLGIYTEAVESFGKLMQTWLDNSSTAIKRLAFVCQLLKPTASKEESYAQLGRLLPRVDVDPSGSEFQYKINRPRLSRIIPDMMINRLCTWQGIKLNLGVHAVAGGVSTTVDNEFYGCLLQMDINTPQERTDELPSDRLLEIWDELIGFGNEIAAKGDSR